MMRRGENSRKTSALSLLVGYYCESFKGASSEVRCTGMY